MRIYLLIPILFIMACSSNNQTEEKSASITPPTNLSAMLDTIWNMEQTPIRLRDSLMKVHGPESSESTALDALVHKNHDINEKKIIGILEKYGWPDPKLIGEQGNLTICNVIQHSPNEVRLKYLPMMRQAVMDKKLAPRLLARAEDRIATEQGALQIYGGQLKYYPETKTMNVWPVVDPINIDKRRAEIGLEPIANYLKRRFDFDWNLEEQIKRTAEFEKTMLLQKKKLQE